VAVDLGTLTVKLAADVAELKKGLDQANAQIKGVSDTARSAGQAMVGAFDGVVGQMKGIGKDFTNLGKVLGKVFSENASPSTKAFAQEIENLSGVSGESFRRIGEGAKTAGLAIKGIGTAIGLINGPMALIAGAAVGLVGGFIVLRDAIKNGFTVARDALLVIFMGPFGIAAAWIGGFVDQVKIVWREFGGSITSTFKSVWSSVVDASKAAGAFMISSGQWILDAYVKVATGLRDVMADAFRWILAQALDAAVAIGRIPGMEGVSKGMISGISTAASGVNAAQAAFDPAALVVAMKSAISSSMDWFAKEGAKALAAIGDGAKGLWTDAKSTLSKGWSDLMNLLGPSKDAIGDETKARKDAAKAEKEWIAAYIQAEEQMKKASEEWVKEYVEELKSMKDAGKRAQINTPTGSNRIGRLSTAEGAPASMQGSGLQQAYQQGVTGFQGAMAYSAKPGGPPVSDAFTGAAGPAGAMAKSLASGDFIGAITALVASSSQFTRLMNSLNGILKIAADVVGTVLDPFNDLITKIGGFLTPILQAMTPLFTGLASAVVPIAVVLQVLTPALAALAPIIKAFLSVVVLPFNALAYAAGILQPVITGVAWAFLKVAEGISWVWNGIVGAVQSIINGLGDIADLVGLGGPIHDVANALNSLKVDMGGVQNMESDLLHPGGLEMPSAGVAYPKSDPAELKSAVTANTVATTENTAATKQVAEAITNLPAGFKVQAARYNSQDARERQAVIQTGSPIIGAPAFQGG
jgi:hypothetical protein